MLSVQFLLENPECWKILNPPLLLVSCGFLSKLLTVGLETLSPVCGPEPPPRVWTWRPPGCGSGDPPRPDPSTSPLGVDLETPQPPLARPLNFPGWDTTPLETCCKACWDTTCIACWDTTPSPCEQNHRHV